MAFSKSDKIGAYKEQMLNLLDYKKLINFTKTTDQSIGINKNIFIEDFKNLSIRIENLSFKYPTTDKYVLKNINMIIQNKEKLVVVGMNGAGKTSLIKLLCKFYKTTQGKIFINNIDI